MKPYSVLIIEDRPDIATRLKTAVAAHASLVVGDVCWTLDHGLQRLFDLKPRVVLVDLGLPDGSGIEAIKAVAAAWIDVQSAIILASDSTRGSLETPSSSSWLKPASPGKNGIKSSASSSPGWKRSFSKGACHFSGCTVPGCIGHGLSNGEAAR